ncbi:MAG: zf-HC2 domain-containing protein [Acidimicrobiia bacterium]
MSVLTCAQVRELAPELALDVLTGAERAEAVAHINECSRCRNLLVDLSGAADALTLLVPEAEPPRGFEQNVLAALDTRRRQRWTRLRQGAVLAVAAAAACIVTLVLVRVVDSSRDSETVAVTAPVDDVLTAPMIGGGNQVVGQVFVTPGEQAWAYLFVDYGQVPSGNYGVEIKGADHSGEAGELQITDGRGYWAGVVPELDAGTTVALVDADGRAVCRAKLA